MPTPLSIEAVGTSTIASAAEAFEDIQDLKLKEVLSKVQETLQQMVTHLMEERQRKEEQTFEARMKRAMGFMKTKLTSLASNLGTAAEKIQKAFVGFFEKMASVAKAISAKAKEMGGKIYTKSGEFKDYVKEKMGNFADSTKTFYVETMKPIISKATEPVKRAFDSAVEKIKPIMQSASDRVAYGYLGAKESMGKAARIAGEKLAAAGTKVEHSASTKRAAKKKGPETSRGM
jgi:hypothetical protein